MKLFSSWVILILFLMNSVTGCSQSKVPKLVEYTAIKSGAEQMNVYLPLIQNKNIAVVTNLASVVETSHLVDTLLSRNIKIAKIFIPEHGFRGLAEAGELIENGKDTKTGIEIISLYGNHKKPNKDDLKGIDLVLFDLQDVGVRFYTYISTLTYVMEACAENQIKLIVLDRPNPNGYMIDGPILEPEFTSFVGMHHVPVAYAMTIGEYGLMVNGEKWLSGDLNCDLIIIPLESYTHNIIFKLPVPPSPNLPNWQSVYLYPSLCFFEGTIVSVGRGTDYPFQIYGHPDFLLGSFSFIPESMPGKSLHPKFEGKQCFGQELTGYAGNFALNPTQLNLGWLISSYKLLSSTHAFFTDYFDLLAGTDRLRKQIESGMNEAGIRESWQEDLENFKKTRAKYLIYD